MDIKDLADLSKVIDLCRKKGIESLKISNGIIEFRLKEGFSPKKRGRPKESSDPVTEKNYSDEEILLWSSAGIPTQDSSEGH